MQDTREYTPVDRALARILRSAKPGLGTESVAIRDAYARVAAEDMASPIDVPDQTRSHMDGYAVQASDLKGANPQSPKILRLNPSDTSRVAPGHTTTIVTGGILPRGADAVVPVEETRKTGNRVVFTTEHKKGDHLFPRGADIKKGSLLLARGSTIRAQDVGLLALFGMSTVDVYSKPKVALLPTGSELTDEPGPHPGLTVRESHTPIFENLIRAVGGDPIRIGIVPDDVDRITAGVEKALLASDLVFTLGGTSVSNRDLVEQALRKLTKRANIVHGIKMHRGRVAGVATVNRKAVVMLPGPVQGAMNAFVLLGIPLIFKLEGRSASTLPSLTARMGEGWRAKSRFRNFTKVLYVRLEGSRGEFVAHPIVRETESMTALTESNGFTVVPERTTQLEAGRSIPVHLLPGFSYVSGQFLADR